MNRVLKKALLILFLMMLCIMIMEITSNADGSCTINISASTVEVGQKFTVSINPGDLEGFNGTISVTNASPASAKVAYYKEMPNMNNTSAEFTANAAGKCVVTVKMDEEVPKGQESGAECSYDPREITVKTPEPPPQNTNTQPANTNTEPKPQNTNTQPKPENTNTNPPVNNTAPKNNTVVNNTVEPTVVNPEFKAVNEKVYAVNSCNVRSSCSTATNNNKIGSLEKDELVIRTGVSSEWSRIVFNGKVAYVASKLLTTTPPDDEENTVEENTVENEISNELDTIKSEVGVLPEVGNNVSVQLFFVTTMISISIISSFIYLKIKEK